MSRYNVYGLVPEPDNEVNLKVYKQNIFDDFYRQYGLDDPEIDLSRRPQHPFLMSASQVIADPTDGCNCLVLVLPLTSASLRSKWLQLSNDQLITIVHKLSQAILFLHASNIVHLAITFDNVFLDTGLSPHLRGINNGLVVDDVRIGRARGPDRIPILYRSRELLTGDLRLSAKTDVWMMGILMLSIFSTTFNGLNQSTSPNSSSSPSPPPSTPTPSSTTPTPSTVPTPSTPTLTQANTPLTVEMTLTHVILHLTPDKFNVRVGEMLDRIDAQRKPLLMDLLSHCLDFNTDTRADVNYIVAHPFFSAGRLNRTQSPNQLSPYIPGVLLSSPVPTAPLLSGFRNLVKAINHYATVGYAKSRIEVLFLACDLLFRHGPQLNRYPEDLHIPCAITCLWMAVKLVESGDEALANLIAVTDPNTDPEAVLWCERHIVDHLEGLLNQNMLYRACQRLFQLQEAFYQIILNQDPNAYGKINIQDFVNALSNPGVVGSGSGVGSVGGVGGANNPTAVGGPVAEKDINIEQFFA